MNKSKNQGRPAIYDAAYKIAIAREYLSSELGVVRLARKYGLRSGATERFFVKWYKEKYPDGVTEQEVIPTEKSPPASEKMLKEAGLKIAALEMLIAEASKELKIDLVKKFGTKLSKK
jgi:transposase-like protein